MKYIPKAVSTFAARTLLQTQKHSPEALLAAGLAGMGATVYLACRATLRVEDTLIDHEKRTVDIQTASTASDKELQRALTREKVELAVNIAKLYAPAVICGSISVSMLVGGNAVLNRRNAALAAAYGTLEKAYSDYRDRVRENYGEQRELEIYRDIRTVERENEITGKTKKVQEPNGGTPYSFYFDETNRNWDYNMPTYNYQFLRQHENFATQRLQARGHLFLNEVLEAIGMPHTQAGAVVGWIKGAGDDYVDFGLPYDSEDMINFMAGRSGVWLDFNCAGTIFDKI